MPARAARGRPVIDEKVWRLDVAGMIAKPLTLKLADLKALPRQYA
jgi:DMSO/TMAO reductase YedYZ molybdopterin-dependent catalytic subunit